MDWSKTTLAQSFMPWHIKGDGNCLFNAIAYAYFYSDTNFYTKKLKKWVVEEFVQHPSWYNKDHPSYCFPFGKNSAIVLKDSFEFNYLVTTLSKDVLGDMNHLLALSAVLKSPIESFYPQLPHNHPNSMTIIGREVENVPPTIRVMWTTTKLPKSFEQFEPNHFVPLIPLDNLNDTLDKRSSTT